MNAISPLTSHDLITALHAAIVTHPDPRTNAIDEAELLAFGVPLADEYLPVMIGNDGRAAAEAARGFIHRLADASFSTPVAGKVVGEHLVGIAGVVRQMRNEGRLHPYAFGRAVVILYTLYIPPEGYAGANTSFWLQCLRDAPSASRMTDAEQREFDALPETIRLYRAAETAETAEAVSGLSWTTSRNTAEVWNITRPCWTKGGREPPSSNSRVVALDVPKSVALAWIGNGLSEVIIDYERIDRGIANEVPKASPTALAHAAIRGGLTGLGGFNGIAMMAAGLSVVNRGR